MARSTEEQQEAALRSLMDEEEAGKAGGEAGASASAEPAAGPSASPVSDTPTPAAAAANGSGPPDVAATLADLTREVRELRSRASAVTLSRREAVIEEARQIAEGIVQGMTEEFDESEKQRHEDNLERGRSLIRDMRPPAPGLPVGRTKDGNDILDPEDATKQYDIQAVMKDNQRLSALQNRTLLQKALRIKPKQSAK